MNWWIAITPLSLVLVLAITSAIAGLWRVSSWNVGNLERLLTQEGVPVGAQAPDLTGHADEYDVHVTFEGVHTFVIFAEGGCPPCLDLIDAADKHPALAHARLIYASSSEPEFPVALTVRQWEIIRFHDEPAARRHWNAPVSPFYHFIDPLGRVVSKGVASRPSHLDHLLQAAPPLLARYEEVLDYGKESSSNGRS